jgi:hypothetical protein
VYSLVNLKISFFIENFIAKNGFLACVLSYSNLANVLFFHFLNFTSFVLILVLLNVFNLIISVFLILQVISVKFFNLVMKIHFYRVLIIKILIFKLIIQLILISLFIYLIFKNLIFDLFTWFYLWLGLLIWYIKILNTQLFLYAETLNFSLAFFHSNLVPIFFLVQSRSHCWIWRVKMILDIIFILIFTK